MTTDCDLVIAGSGFGGSILAMIARRLGYRVMLLERGRHPRFAIGESASPLAGVLIEQLSARYDLPRLAPLSAYGAWQRAYPEIGCGLKRGFSYFAHCAGARYRADARRSTELLVAASPHDALSDTHWLRADVDHFLVREAIALGVDYHDGVTLGALDPVGPSAVTVTGERNGQPLRVRASLVVDATGPRGFLSRACTVPDVGFAGYPATQALFSHFTGVARCDQLPDFTAGRAAGESLEAAPYPPDAAALHHVFDGGWMWVLRFDTGVTSAGVAVTDALAAELGLADGAAAWQRLLARYPSVGAQFAAARAIREFTWMPRLASRSAAAAGERWAMLPSAAAFVDPLFSTGMPLTLLGIERLARLLARGLPDAPGLAAYSDATLADADCAARFVAGCYAAFPRFETFAAYSMFYFAAASASELARRLDAPHRPRRFLCADHPAFGAATTRLAPGAGGVGPDYGQEVAAAIECLNIAGLADPAKRNWYPVDLQDAVRGASKLALSPEAVRRSLEQLLRRAAAQDENHVNSQLPTANSQAPVHP